VKRDLLKLLDLRRDQHDADAIDATIRSGAELGGTNLWVLFFAILIASVGLNVNSTATIIGAMLISPLMGPIVGIGYGAAVFDLKLIRHAARNLAIFTSLSLVTSVAYFALSPLTEAGSELLGRTSPTLWDVLIALFGGAAGMVAATRRGPGNIAPGVAIATALMPPLCTAGFGIAHLRADIFAGAFYLFLINGVFIAAASLAMARVLRLPSRGVLEPAVRQRHRVVLAVGLIAVLAPSLWLGLRFVQHEVFVSGAERVARALQADGTSRVFSHEVDPARRVLRLTLIGGAATAQQESRVLALLGEQGIADAKVEFRSAGEVATEVARLRTELRTDMTRGLMQQSQAIDVRVRAIEAELSKSAGNGQEALRLAAEIQALQPLVRGVSVAKGTQAVAGTAGEMTLVMLSVQRPLPLAERERLQRWLALRLGREVKLVEQADVAVARRK